MSDTPLYDATLADQLQRARREGERARSRWALAERQAGERVAEAERAARMAIAAAERAAANATHAAQREVAEARAVADRRVALVEREAQLRQALVAQETEEQLRHALVVSAPPLAPLHIDLDEEPPERDAPAIPTMEELMRPMPGINRFLDSLLGAPER